MVARWWLDSRWRVAAKKLDSGYNICAYIHDPF